MLTDSIVRANKPCHLLTFSLFYSYYLSTPVSPFSLSLSPLSLSSLSLAMYLFLFLSLPTYWCQIRLTDSILRANKS